jgi:hypothetical protein
MTQHGGQGRPNLVQRQQQFLEILSSSSESSIDSNYTCNGTESDVSFVVDAVKPPATRVIVDTATLIESIEKNGKCKQCYWDVEATVRTTCLATSITVSCLNPDCNFMYLSPSPVQVDIESADNRERSTDYAVNILYVLGFISCGDGCTEAARILGLLGLPNDTTMERRSFGIIEDRISPTIDELNKEILLENLVEEARLSMEASNDHDANDFMLWQQSLTNKNTVLLDAKKPPLMCSFDMGWQQRSSGKRYNSQSGHALLVGQFSRKPVSFVIKSKRCNFCITWKNRNKDVVAQSSASRWRRAVVADPHLLEEPRWNFRCDGSSSLLVDGCGALRQLQLYCGQVVC